MQVLLSLKPKFVEQIFSQKKRFEYRKAVFSNKNIDTVIIYASKPIGRIVGEFHIKQILCDTPENIWSKTHQYAGVSYAFFVQYFQGKGKAYAIEIDKVFQYDEPINPYTKYSNFTAPQSFCYIK